MLLIIKVFSFFKFIFIFFLFYMKLYKLRIEFVIKIKKLEIIFNFKIDKEDGNGNSSYLYLFCFRYVKCMYYICICCGFIDYCYFFKNMLWVSFYYFIEWNKIDFILNLLFKVIFYVIDLDILMNI